MDMLKNCKKALSVVAAPHSPYKDYIGTGNLPSGMAFEDYLMFVRRVMFKMLVNASGASDFDSSTTETTESGILDDENIPHTPELMGSWYFAGYFVFALLGPIVPLQMTAHCAELLMTSPCESLVGKGPDKKKTIEEGAGRAAARRKSPASTTALPPGVVKVYPDGAALVTEQHVQIASIAQARLMNEGQMMSKTNNRIISKHARKVALVQAMIMEIKDLLRILDSTDERRAALIDKLIALNEQFRSCIEKCKDVEDSIINDEMNRIVDSTSLTAFIDATIASAIAPDHASSITPQSTNKKRRCTYDYSPASGSTNNGGLLKDDNNNDFDERAPQLGS
jgi:hypothetical protein